MRIGTDLGGEYDSTVVDVDVVTDVHRAEGSTEVSKTEHYLKIYAIL